MVNSICVQPALPSSDIPDVKRFLCQVPDVRAFSQVWMTYTALRCASTGDPNVCASLSSFLMAVIDHDTKWHWPAVTEYILTVCECRFGYASASDWADDDLSAWQKALGGIPRCDVSTSRSPAKPTTQASATIPPASSSVKRQRQDLSTQPTSRNSNSSRLQHLPPPRPNTTLTLYAFDPTTLLACVGSMQLQQQAWERLLWDYPDERYRTQVTGMIHHGCTLGYDGPLRQANRHVANLPIDTDGHAHLRCEILTRLGKGRLTIVPPTSALIESPIGVIPKPRSAKLCTIHHLSHPRRPASSTLPSVNAGIHPSFVRIQYESICQLVDFVWSNPNCLLWKGDLEDAFWHIVTAESDASLLGFQYDGTHYWENTLTFGGSSSPFLFNLMAEFLHWVMASCLPSSWLINHYLDDTFGAVPAEAADLSLLPVHALALASAALGLCLSAKKTFANLTRLEILGIDIDLAAQTIGITPERQAHILSQCCHLLCHGTANLLDMQQVAGLLQFVLQVFPCSKAFLCRLYNCTHHQHSAGRQHIPRPALAKLAWWATILESWSGTSILSPSPLVVTHVWTDACPRGYGAHLGLATSTAAVFSREVPKRHHKKNICFLEALAVLEALQQFGPQWTSPTTVVIHVDNNVEHGLHSGSSRDPLTQKLLREIFGFCFTRNITLHPMRISSTDNVLADLLSCCQFCRIHLGITSVAATLLWNSLAPSTRDRASGTIAAFCSFCAWHFGTTVACLPAFSIQLLEWLGSMSSAGCSFHSAKHELGHLHSHHVDLGLSLAGFECGCLDQALRGYKRIHGVWSTGAKLTITLPLLRRLVSAIDTFGDLSAHDRTMFKAAFMLSFACFLCSGKVVWDRHTDPAVILWMGSVDLAADHAIITLPASKTDPFRLGVKVVAPLVGGPECPIAYLCHLLSGRPSSAPLFGLGPSGMDSFPC
ncbi:hypothetical protein NDA18_001963 [Ustilago nuda]|nr:hypothetical protein NDA18_001963 [Ustilago nuda]